MGKKRKALRAGGVGTLESCTCEKCVAACTRVPGWMTPDEAQAALDEGHAGRLMRDWFEPDRELGNKKRIYVLCPASLGREGSDAPDSLHMLFLGYFGRCTFLRENRCELHDTGFKPVMCRTALLCQPDKQSPEGDKMPVAKLWNTRHGRAVVKRWKQLVGESNATCF